MRGCVIRIVTLPLVALLFLLNFVQSGIEKILDKVDGDAG
jgi:hypothetical protein